MTQSIAFNVTQVVVDQLQSWSFVGIVLIVGVLGLILTMVTMIVSKKYPEVQEQKSQEEPKGKGLNWIQQIVITILVVAVLIGIIALVLSQLNTQVVTCANCTMALN